MYKYTHNNFPHFLCDVLFKTYNKVQFELIKVGLYWTYMEQN